MPATERTLTAWGRSSRTVSRAWQPETPEQTRTALSAAGPRGVIARGYARSYGDVCLNDGGDVIDATRLGAIRSFDAGSGTLVCEAGVAYEQVMRYCLPTGWQPAVCPGTAVVSMGGGLANDIHGKNQHVVGNFGGHVDWFDLLCADGEVRRVSRDTDAELFAATLGGIGLTGVVLALQLRLMRVPSNAMDMTEIRVPDLDTFLDLVVERQTDHPHVVGWIDALATGRHLGRGILELGRPAAQGVREPLGLTLKTPFEFPTWVLNRYTVRAFNEAYYHRLPASGRRRRVHVNRFLYPLDAIHDWNRMYGWKGVFQFQCLVPFADGRRAIARLMAEITHSRGASFLAVLKAMGRPSEGMFSFAGPGYTLAMDFPRRPHTRALVERLHDIVIEHGGRIYLAKDACLTPERFRAMYPDVSRFQAVLARLDPEGRVQSDMSRRLGLGRGACS